MYVATCVCVHISVHECHVMLLLTGNHALCGSGRRGVGAKFEVVRQILRLLASFIIRKLEQM